MKYNRTYHLPISPGATGDDRIARHCDGLVGVPIVITEKLDGENSGMDTGGVYARSHAVYTQSPWSREVRDMHSMMRGDIPQGWMLFGENMEGVHSIEYTELESWWYMFAIRKETPHGLIWSSWEEIESWAYLLGVPTVPLLWSGVVHSEDELFSVVSMCTAKSKLGGTVPRALLSESPAVPAMEGVVVRAAAEFPDEDFPFVVQKWVRGGHVTTDEHWTKNWRKHKINYK